MGLDLVICFIAIAVMGLCCWWVVRWFFQIGTKNSKKDSGLTPADLVVLEETTKRLMDDLKTVTEDCVARIDKACKDAEERIANAQQTAVLAEKPSVETVGSLSQKYASEPAVDDIPAKTAQNQVSTGQTVTSFAKSTGLTTGEVELMRGLREYGKGKK